MNKKLIAKIVIALFLISAVLFVVNSDKRKIIGTWYYVSDPDKSISIYRNGSAEIYVEHEGWVSCTYKYSDGVITFYPVVALLYDVEIYDVDIKKDTMYLTRNGSTKELRKSYDKAYEEYEKQKAEEDDESFESVFEKYRKESTKPKLRDAEARLEEEGYYAYEYINCDDDTDNNSISYCFDVNGVFSDESSCLVYVEYSYENGEWYDYGLRFGF